MAASTAIGHVAPSETTNNRYLTLAPLGDRLRLVYTVYMGEEPGRRARARIDRNRDGQVGEGEAEAFGAQLGAEVASRLDIEIDGQPVPVSWSSIDVGMADRATNGGSFAVDLVAWLCYEQPRDRIAHSFLFRDQFVIPSPGETELRADESPGVRVTRLDLPGKPATQRPQLEHKWRGGPGPAAEGVELAIEVDPDAATFSAEPCGPASIRSSARRFLWIGLAILAAGLAGLVSLVISRGGKRTGSSR
jgi:hypothetical protein